jgi:hypothetical protein
LSHVKVITTPLFSQKTPKKKTQKNTLRTLQDKGQSDFCSCGSDSGGARVNYSGTFKAETNVDATG